MLRACAALLLLGLVAARSNIFDESLTEEWENFKESFGRSYESDVTEGLRRLVWEQNVRFVQKHNLEADRGLHTFWTGVNEYADMTVEEFKAVMNGYIMRNGTSGAPVFEAAIDVKDLPATVDWRDKGYVTEIKNQGQCGSCWSFSTTGSLEGQHFKKTGQLVSLSEQNLVDCSTKYGNHGCKGGLMDNAFRYIKDNNGIDTEESYPYRAKNGFCHFKKENVGATDTGFVDIQHGDESALQQAVATVGPIAVAIDAGHQSFQLYRHGVYSERRCSSKKLDHGVLAVGYGTEEGKDYWLVKNSWGPSWGLKGYIMMSRNEDNQCGIATQASYPTV
jgi:cathepsin L